MKQVDKQLIIAVQQRCGGGRVHAAVQMTAAYEMAVARYNHPKQKDKEGAAREIDALYAKLYAMSL